MLKNDLYKPENILTKIGSAGRPPAMRWKEEECGGDGWMAEAQPEEGKCDKSATSVVFMHYLST
jgi:hypothetical protein